MQIANATVVITGASSGIGRATALACAEEGANVVLAARNAAALNDVAGTCRERGARALAVATDVADQDAVERLAVRAVERFGRIDVWINDAAVMAYGTFEELPADVHRRVIETNLLGQIHGARAALPIFRRQDAGTLINVASLYGKMTSPYVSPYVISKYGVIGFSEVLRQELHAAKAIHVCTVMPGSVDTPIFRHAANVVGRQPRPVPLVSSPDRVVRAIMRLIRRPRATVSIGWSARFFAIGHALLPGLYRRLAPMAMRIGGLAREEVDPGPGNVFEPMTEWYEVTGGWRHPVLTRTAVGLAALGAAAVLTRTRAGE